MSSRQCNPARRCWSDAFDGGTSVSPAAADHLAHCAECRAFQAQATFLREQLAAVPLPASSPDRDLELLALLRSPKRQPDERRASVWVRCLEALRAPSVPTLGAVGFAAFAVTLVTAHLLAALPAERAPIAGPGAASARVGARFPAADAVERWLASPQPRLLPLRAPGQALPPPDRGGESPTAPRRRGGVAPNDLGRLS